VGSSRFVHKNSKPYLFCCASALSIYKSSLHAKGHRLLDYRKYTLNQSERVLGKVNDVPNSYHFKELQNRRDLSSIADRSSRHTNSRAAMDKGLDSILRLGSVGYTKLSKMEESQLHL
jgi:hypothetical protein